MTDRDTVMREALAVLDDALDAQSNPARTDFPTIHDFGAMRRAADAMRACLAEPVQPVAVPMVGSCQQCGHAHEIPSHLALVPVEPTPEMIEAARQVKRERLLRSVEEIKRGKRPDTIGMALAVDEEWTAMLAAAPKGGA